MNEVENLIIKINYVFKYLYNLKNIKYIIQLIITD